MEKLKINNVEIFQGLSLNIPEGSPKPKSALGFIEFLMKSKEAISGKRVLELGCGHHASLAHSALYCDAKKITASDISNLAIDVVSRYGNPSIEYITSDLFSNIDDEFDIILFNPPQMPMENRDKENKHDSPGPSGLEVIERTLIEFSKLRKGSESMYMMIFDFLSSSSELSEITRKLKISVKPVYSYRRNIRPGGATESNLTWIVSKYPSYNFSVDEKGMMFLMCNILQFENL